MVLLPSRRHVTSYMTVASLLLLLLLVIPTFAQQVDNTAKATVQVSPPQITLTWSYGQNQTASSVIISRKGLDDPTFTTIATVTGTNPTSYTDTNVQIGQRYEYRLHIGNYYYEQFVCSGIQATADENRGKLILLVDETVKDALTLEIRRLIQDLAGDGWTVIRHDVPRHVESEALTQPPSIKAIIQADYNADPTHVKAVFFFGHVPIAYGGDTAPDGHAEHAGAWPEDTYYADMDGTWTDTTDWTYGSGRKNGVGDGYFDQNYAPSPLELQLGRVDLFDMPEFAPRTEVDLLRDYLKKDHDFRMKRKAVQNIGGATGAWASQDDFWNITGLCDSINGCVNPDGTFIWFYPPTTPYLWMTMHGLGTPTGQYSPPVDGLALSPRHCPAEFTLLSGSFYGQWDYENDFMRAILGSPNDGLTSMWGVGTQWFLHRMGMGGTIGDTVRVSINGNPYAASWDPSGCNLALLGLMGDPSLRQNYVAPPSAVTVQPNGSTATVKWTASPDSVLGYYVYRGAGITGPFTRITPSLVTGTTFTDSSYDPANPVYLVRAMALTTTASGTYNNLSQGAFGNAVQIAPVAQAQSLVVDENTATPLTLGSSLAAGATPLYTIVTPPAHGTLSGTLPNLTYTPTTNYFGSDLLKFEVNDGVVTSAPATITITINHLNQRPVTVAQSVAATANTPYTFSLQASDADPSTTLTCHSVSGPSHGSVTFTGTVATYTPAVAYTGTDTFDYVANDGQVDSLPATVTVTVTAQMVPMNGLTCWLMADALNLADGTPVTAWPDSSGNNNAARAGTSDARASSLYSFMPPTIKASASPSGKPALVFTGGPYPYTSGTRVDIPTVAVGQRNTIIMVAKQNDPSFNREYLFAGLNNQPGFEYGMLLCSDYGTNTYPIFCASGVNWQYDDTVGSFYPGYHRLALVCADSGATLYMENTTKKTYAAPTAGLGALKLGWETYTGSPLPFLGEMAEVLVYNRPLNATELALIDSYLQAKYWGGTIEHAPLALPQSVLVAKGVSQPITLMVNDPENDPLTYKNITNPLHGTLTGTAPNMIYTPAAGYTGPDAISFSANDGHFDSNTATITINVSDAGYEADLAPRMGGNGKVTLADWVQVGRFVAGMDTPSGTEFLRADCAPSNTLGDGKLSVADWVQAGRYAAALDPLTPAGGPAAPVSGLAAARTKLPVATPRTLSLAPVAPLARGKSGIVRVQLQAQGDENALGFSLHFDPKRLRFVSAKVVGAAATATLNVNTTRAATGDLGLALMLPLPNVMPKGAQPVMELTFTALATAPVSLNPLTFTDTVITREVATATAQPLPVRCQNGTVTIKLK